MITVFGKENCKLCEAAKSKLRMMEVPFKVDDIEKYLKPHEGWRDDGSVEIQACYQDIETYPVIMVDGKAMSYPAAMKVLKSKPSSKPAEVEELVGVAAG